MKTHGTGTPLGDAIEIEALRNVYAPRPQDQRCALCSVKSNMGHLDTAAGICRTAENRSGSQSRANSSPY
ncbi:irp1 [Klebsiella pneumoniae subsp. rhinoscleromatis]|nr:irp1 [Klebsiella pneumoniae subsp. rhinoscleromatis]